MSIEEQIKLEHSTLMEEYKALRDEMNRLLDASRQTLNISMGGIGLLVAGAPLILEANLPTMFLVASIFLYFIAFAQVRYTLLAIRQGEHLKRETFPYIRRTLQEMSTQRQPSHVLTWEASVAQRPKSLFLLPVTGADYLIPVGAAVFALGTYMYVMLQTSQPIPLTDWTFIVINLLLLVYSLYVRIWGRYKL